MDKITSFSGNYRFLSNFCYSPLVFAGYKIQTVEHGYQAWKTSDQSEFFRILLARSPGEAKRLGQKVKLKLGWDNVKETVMLDFLRAKFQNPIFKRSLLETGNTELEEGNTWGDTYWGIHKGQGKNRLGILLMQVREELRNASSS